MNGIRGDRDECPLWQTIITQFYIDHRLAKENPGRRIKAQNFFYDNACAGLSHSTSLRSSGRA